MVSIKKLALLAGVVGLFVGSAAMAGIGENITWNIGGNKNCFQIGPITSCKPSKHWDTQKTKDYNAKYKFVLHRSGANPVCWLRFDDNPKGKTAHRYANWLKSRLKQRGYSNLTQRKEVIAGRNVSFIGGYDAAKNFRTVIGVWRNRDVGMNMECTAAAKDFSVYEPQFQSFIANARVVSEGRF